MNPLVSAIIPTFNGASFVKATLESVLAQTYAPVEVIVCDDGSSDGTLSILAQYGDRIRVLRQENCGVAQARNHAAGEARGELLAFLDHDDLWEPDMLATLVPLLLAHKEWGLVYSDSWIIDAQGNVHGKRSEFLEYAQGWIFTRLLTGNFIPVETTLMRAGLYRELGGSNPGLHYLEDYDLCLRAAHRAQVGFHPGPLARYRIHERNLSHEIEPMLLEWVRLVSNMQTAYPDLSSGQIEIIEAEQSRLYADLAWRALRRKDFHSARLWLASAGPRARRSRVWRVRVFRSILSKLPASWTDRILALLPRRKLYGVVVPVHGRLVLRPAPKKTPVLARAKDSPARSS